MFDILIATTVNKIENISDTHCSQIQWEPDERPRLFRDYLFPETFPFLIKYQTLLRPLFLFIYLFLF